jgi:hypothetical protein
MKIFISGKFSPEVFDDAYDLTSTLNDSLDMEAIGSAETSLNLFVYFPVILSDELGVENKSLRRYSKLERSEGVNSEISFHQWVASSRRERVDLLADSLCRAIMDTSSSKLPEVSKAIICGEVDKAKTKILDG